MTKTALVSGFCLAALLAHAASAQQPPATPPPGAAKVHAACATDITKLCPDVQTGGGRVMQCLKEHKDQVSDGCKQAIAAAKQEHQQQQAAPPPKSQ
jgi:hypothetical protein